MPHPWPLKLLLLPHRFAGPLQVQTPSFPPRISISPGAASVQPPAPRPASCPWRPASPEVLKVIYWFLPVHFSSPRREFVGARPRSALPSQLQKFVSAHPARASVSRGLIALFRPSPASFYFPRPALPDPRGANPPLPEPFSPAQRRFFFAPRPIAVHAAAGAFR